MLAVFFCDLEGFISNPIRLGSVSLFLEKRSPAASDNSCCFVALSPFGKAVAERGQSSLQVRKTESALGGHALTTASGLTRLCLLPILAASQGEVPAEPLEELAYRRSLRVALDVLNQRTGLPPESSSREERTALSSREKPTELASSLCDPSSSCLREDVPSSSGPQRRERVHPRLSGSPTCRKDPKGKVDHKKELGKSGSPQALVVPSARGGSQDGGGSRTCCRSRTTPSKRGRSLAQEPSLCQRAPSVSEGDGEKESSLPTSGSPPRVREKGLCAKGEDPGLPWCGPAVLPAPGRPACPDAQGRPAKRPCPDGSQRLPATQLEPGAAPCPRQGPRGRMTLRSAAKLGLPAPCASTEETNLHILVEEGKGLWPRVACAGGVDLGSHG